MWSATSAVFSGPIGIGAGRAADIYVAYTLDNRIEKFSDTGTRLTQWARRAPATVADFNH